MRARTFHLKQGSAVYELHLERLEGGRVRLRVVKSSNPEEPTAFPVIEAQAHQRGHKILIETSAGKSWAAAYRTDRGVWAASGEKTAFFEFTRKDVDAASTQPPETEVHAPMTGKIVDVRAKPDQRVAAGEILVIMEAMKMEFKLEAPMEALIESVRCERGQLVDLGQLLVQLKPLADEKA